MYKNIKIVERRPSFSLDICSIQCTTQVIIWCHKKNRCEGSLSNKTFYSVNIFVCISTFLDYIKVKCFHFYNLFIQIKRFLHSFSPKVTLNTFFSVLIVLMLCTLIKNAAWICKWQNYINLKCIWYFDGKEAKKCVVFANCNIFVILENVAKLMKTVNKF